MARITPQALAELDPEWLQVAINSPYHSDIISLVSEDPWPHLVHYQKHRAIYCSPAEFLTWRPEGPSDCTWIVPGTGC